MPQAQEKSGLERALAVVTEVKAGEGGTALLLTLNVFLLLTAYYVIKPVREALILEMEGGAEYKSYMGAAIAVGLLFAVPAYAKVAEKTPKNRLVVGVTLFFASNLVLFYLASALPAVRSNLGLVFYGWVGIFNMMVVAQFWAFANDLYTVEQGKRLFAMIGIGASVGAAAGSWLAARLIEGFGVYPMLLVCAAMLAGFAAITHVIHRRELDNPARGSDADDPGAKKEKPEGAFKMVFAHRYLTLLAAFSLLFTFVNTNGEYMLGKLVSEAADALVSGGELSADKKGAWIGSFYGTFFLYVNILGVFLQTFVVSRLVKFGGLKLAFLVFPVIALLDAIAIVIMPVLLVIRLGKTAENASDYSINNTVRNMLWLPTTQQMKYVAKQAVDTFFVRMGDVGSAVVVFLVSGFLAGSEVRSLAALNVVLVGAWLVVAFMILKENGRLTAEREAAAAAA